MIVKIYCTVLYYIVLYCTLLRCIVLYCTALYCTVHDWTALYCYVLTILYYTVLYYAVLHRTALDCTSLYCTEEQNTYRHPVHLQCTYLRRYICSPSLFIDRPSKECTIEISRSRGLLIFGVHLIFAFISSPTHTVNGSVI